MIAVQIADHFILHRDRFAVDTPVGYTLPDMVLTVVLCLLAEKAKPTKQM